MAAALAAVDARFSKKEPKPEEMDSFAEDLQIGDVDAEFDEEDGDFDDFDDGGIDFEIDDEIHIDVGGEASLDDRELPEHDHLQEDVAIADSAAINALKREYTRISKQLAASEERRQEMEEQVAGTLNKLRSQVARAERSREKMRRLTSDAQNAREARDVAEQRAAALRQTIEKLQLDLEKSLERRRRDLTEQKEQLTSKIVTGFLPIMDHLQLALEHAGADASTLIKGVQMVMGQFVKNFEQYQIRPISSQSGTQFDPYKHEAVEMVADSECEPNTIVRTIQTGYESNGKLIRAARVVVAKASRPDADTAHPKNADDLTEAAEHQRPKVEEPGESSESVEGVDLNQDINDGTDANDTSNTVTEESITEPEG